MKTLRALLLLASLLPPVLRALPSDPVGVFNLRLLGNSDTIVSLPLLRPALVEAPLASRTSNHLTLTSDVPALPPSGAFVLVMTGPLEGAILPISGVAGGELVVTTGAYDLAGLHADPETGDTIAVVPYWTLDTVFPDGAGINATTGATFCTEVLLFSNATAAINRAASAVYFYFAGNQSKAAGWYQEGNTAVAKGNTRLDPTLYFVVRHNVATSTSLLLSGAVQMAGFRAPVVNLSTTSRQDNLLSLQMATPTTLAASGLVSAGAFAATTAVTPDSDQLIVFDNTVAGKNKAASAVFFYFGGNGQKPAGWYRVGNTAVSADNFLLKPGEGFILRKQATSTARTDIWSGVPTYLQ